MDGIKTYLLDGQPVDVEDKDIDSFISKYPKAKAAQSFIVKGDTVDVEAKDIDVFKQKYPDAKPTFDEEIVKKKVSSQPNFGVDFSKERELLSQPQLDLYGKPVSEAPFIPKADVNKFRNTAADLFKKKDLQGAIQILNDGITQVAESDKPTLYFQMSNIFGELAKGDSKAQNYIKEINGEPNYSGTDKERFLEQQKAYSDLANKAKPSIAGGTTPYQMIVTDAPQGETTSGVGLAKPPKTLKQIREEGLEPTLKDYVREAGLKTAEHIGEFVQEAAEGIGAGVKRFGEGATLYGVGQLPEPIQKVLEKHPDYEQLLKENPDNRVIRGIIKATAGAGEGTFAALMHLTPTGVAITEGTKAIEAGINAVTENDKGSTLMKWLFAPVSSFAELKVEEVAKQTGVDPEQLKAEVISGTTADLLTLGDFTSIILGGKYAHKYGKEGIEKVKEKIQKGYELTPEEINDIGKSLTETAKNPEELKSAAQQSGLKLKDESQIDADLSAGFIPVINPFDKIISQTKNNEPVKNTLIENNIPKEEFHSQVDDAYHKGDITEKQSAELKKQFDEIESAKSKLPEEYKNNSLIHDWIKQKEDLKQQKEKLDESFHPKINEEIKKVEEKIQEATGTKPVEKGKGEKVVATEQKPIEKKAEEQVPTMKTEVAPEGKTGFTPIQKEAPIEKAEQKTPKEKPFTTADKKYKVEKTDEGLKITGKRGKKVSVTTQNKVIKEYENSVDYTKGKTAEELAKQEKQQFSNEEEAVRYVAEKSESPIEIIRTHESLGEFESKKSHIDQILDDLINKIDPKNYARFGDPNKVAQGMAKRFFKKGGRKIDDLAQEASEMAGKEVTVEDIVNFVENDKYERKTSPEKIALADRFKKITGLTLNERVKEKALKQELDKHIKEHEQYLNKDNLSRAEAEQQFYEGIKRGEIPIEEPAKTGVAEGAGKSKKGEPTTGEVKAQKEYDAAIADIEQQILDAKKSKQNKLNQLSKRAELFGEEAKTTELFGEKQDLSKENIDKQMQPFNDIISNLEKEKQDLIDNKERLLKKYEGQKEILVEKKLTYEQFKQKEVERLGSRHPSNINEEQVKKRYEKYLQLSKRKEDIINKINEQRNELRNNLYSGIPINALEPIIKIAHLYANKSYIEFESYLINSGILEKFNLKLDEIKDKLKLVYHNISKLSGKEKIKGWDKNFPDVSIHTTIAKMKDSRYYEKAKKGDLFSAIKLVDENVKPAKTLELSKKHPSAILISVDAQESGGINMIPHAFAMKISELTGLEVSDNVQQINKVEHTGADAINRLFSSPFFSGEIKKGREYILVDDVVTSGSSFNSLKRFIESKGGKVVDATTLATTSHPQLGYGGNLAAKSESLKKIYNKFGKDEINSVLLRYGIAESSEQLTNSQANYLANFGSLESLKHRFDSAEKESSKNYAEKLSEVSKKSETSLADKIRKGKIGDDIAMAGVPFAKEVWNGAIEAVAKAVEGGMLLKDAIQKGIDYIKETDWYKNLKDSEKSKAEKRFTEHHTKIQVEEGKKIRGFAESVSEANPELISKVNENPELQYEPQKLKEAKEKLADMTDAEKLDKMNDIGKFASIESGDNFGVLAGLDLLNKYIAEGKDPAPILEKLSKAGTTMGQLIRQFGELKKSRPENAVFLVEKELEKFGRKLTEPQKEILKELSKQDIEARAKYNEQKRKTEKEYTEDNIKELERLKKEAEDKYKNVANYLMDITPKDIWETLGIMLQGNLLTPMSIITNPFSNFLLLPLRISEKVFALPVDAVYSFVTGKPRTITTKGIGAYFKGMGYGIKEAAKQIKTGVEVSDLKKAEVQRGFRPLRSLVQAWTGKDMPVNAKGKIPFGDRAKKVFEGIFGANPEIMFRLLSLGDKPFYRAAERSALYRIASLKGLKGKDFEKFMRFPDMKSAEEIKKIAQEATFQEESGVSKIAVGTTGQIFNALGKIPLMGGALKFLAKTQAPYIKTPSNIISQTLDYAVPPISFAKSIYYASKKNRREALIYMGKAATGAMMIQAADVLYNNNIISPSPDKEEKKKGLSYDVFPPNSINISALERMMNGEDTTPREGDEFISYAKMGILGAILNIRANQGEKAKQEGDDKRDKTAGDYAYSMISAFPDIAAYSLEQSFLQGTNNLMNAIKEKDWDNWISSTFNAVTSVVLPNNLTAANRASREYLPNLTGDNLEERLSNVVKNKLWQTEELPIKINLWGEKIKQTPEGSNAWLYQLFDVTKHQELNDNKLSKTIYDLWQKTQDADVIPSVPSRNVTINKKSIRLNNEQYQNLLEQVGQQRKKDAEKEINTSYFSHKEEEQKIKRLKRVYEDARENAFNKFKKTLVLTEEQKAQ